MVSLIAPANESDQAHILPLLHGAQQYLHGSRQRPKSDGSIQEGNVGKAEIEDTGSCYYLADIQMGDSLQTIFSPQFVSEHKEGKK